MKPLLPYNLLLALTVVVTGLVVLYNVVVRESYATTLLYQFPVVESTSPEAQVGPGTPERELPAEQEGGETAVLHEESAAATIQFPLNINTATAEQLQYIPRVGAVMSQRIIQYREVLGGYTDLAQLKEIKGVGDKTYETLALYLVVDEETGAA